MRQFKLEDAKGIKDYVESLDVCNQFNEIIVDLIKRDSIDDDRIYEVRIMIKSLDRVIYRLQRHRSFIEQIFEFDEYFEQDINRLSAAVLFLRKLLEINDSLTDSRFEIKDFWVSVTVSDETSSYTLNAMIDTKGVAKATLETKFESDQGSLMSNHVFRTKSAIQIEELEDVTKELDRFKDFVRLKRD